MIQSHPFRSKRVLDVALEGHNLFVTVQAGTGKPFLVKLMYKQLKRQGKKVVIMCSSGIAGTVYQDLHLSIPTVHSYYGVLTADLPWQFVVERASTNNLVHDRVKNVDCIIWDEVSMSSARILEIVNSIHNILESGQNKPLFFAGKQVIFVGEFLEL